MKTDPTPDELRTHFCEPCVPGFERVTEAADDSTADIMRHLRYERHANNERRER